MDTLRNDSESWLVLRQRPLNAIPQTIPISFPLTETRITGRPAAMYHFNVTATNQPAGQLEIVSCLWEQEDFLMELEAPYISENVLIQVAESIV